MSKAENTESGHQFGGNTLKIEEYTESHIL